MNSDGGRGSAALQLLCWLPRCTEQEVGQVTASKTPMHRNGRPSIAEAPCSTPRISFRSQRLGLIRGRSEIRNTVLLQVEAVLQLVKRSGGWAPSPTGGGNYEVSSAVWYERYHSHSQREGMLGSTLRSSAAVVAGATIIQEVGRARQI